MRVTKDNIQYLVGWGGSPQDTWRSYETLEEALDECRELAESDEELSDKERESLDVYGDSPETGWGVCPAGDDGAYGACVVAQYYAAAYYGKEWYDWPTSLEEDIEIVDGPLYRVVTYLDNPAEKVHGTDLTLDEARELCEEIAKEWEDQEEVYLFSDTDDDGREWGGCCPEGRGGGGRWPIYEEVPDV